MSAIEIRRTLGPPFIQGDLKSMAAAVAAGDKTVHMLGTLLGKATGLSYRHNAQDDTRPSIALTGMFEFAPILPGEPVVQSTSCYLPSAVQDVIVKTMQGERPAPIAKSPGRKDKAIDVDLNIVFPIRAEIGYRKQDTGGVGYEYVVNILNEMKGEDLLADLRGDNPQLASPQSKPALATPVSKPKGRKPKR